MTSFQSLIYVSKERCKVMMQNESIYANLGLIDVLVKRISDNHVIRVIGYNIISHSFVDLKDYGVLSKANLFVEKSHFKHQDYADTSLRVKQSESDMSNISEIQ